MLRGRCVGETCPHVLLTGTAWSSRLPLLISRLFEWSDPPFGEEKTSPRCFSLDFCVVARALCCLAVAAAGAAPAPRSRAEGAGQPAGGDERPEVGSSQRSCCERDERGR